jgi:hypothetical protein
MATRRSLADGITSPTPSVDPAVEHDFVYGKKAGAANEPPKPMKATSTVPRTPISSKIRTDFAEALKRASLERQLNKIQPNTLQDILEDAIEPWLKSNGYLP